ncbi:hypothetical protein [Sorangium sp. So ce854]
MTTAMQMPMMPQTMSTMTSGGAVLTADSAAEDRTAKTPRTQNY